MDEQKKKTIEIQTISSPNGMLNRCLCDSAPEVTEVRWRRRHGRPAKTRNAITRKEKRSSALRRDAPVYRSEDTGKLRQKDNTTHSSAEWLCLNLSTRRTPKPGTKKTSVKARAKVKRPLNPMYTNAKKTATKLKGTKVKASESQFGFWNATSFSWCLNKVKRDMQSKKTFIEKRYLKSEDVSQRGSNEIIALTKTAGIDCNKNFKLLIRHQL
jgi:hypothetical protein